MDLTLKIKIISIPSLFLLCFLFGIFPYIIKKCRMNNSFLSYANTFSGGLFFGIGIFHLLSEGVEKLSKYSDLPIPYFLASLGYSFILFIQKVIFGYLVPNAENYLKKDEKQQMSLEYNFETHNFEEEDKNEENENIDGKNNQNDIKLNLLIQKEDNNQIDVNCSTNTTRTTTADSIELKILQKKKLSGFIMLLALSIHGLFECLALGIQNNSKNTLFLFIALMIHKWAEAFSLGIFFVQAKLAKKNYYLLIIFFAIIGPIGVLLGIILSKTANEFIEGVFLCISTGTFLYVACSEVIVEEFSTPDKRYLKFFLYLMGTIFAGGLTVFEYLI
jgi:zinc transporter 1/2/3